MSAAMKELFQASSTRHPCGERRSNGGREKSNRSRGAHQRSDVKVAGDVDRERRSSAKVDRGSAEVAGEIAGSDGLLVEGPRVSELTEFRRSDTVWEGTAKRASANFGSIQKMVRNRRQYQPRTFRDTWPACFHPMPMTEAPCSKSLIKQRTTRGNCGGSASCDIQKGHSLKQGLH